MERLKTLERKLCDELVRIGDGNITTQNLESIVKLSTAIEKLMKADYYEKMDGEEYSNARSKTTGRYISRRYDEHGDSYGMDERYDRYMDSKNSYRYSRAGSDKQQMLGDLSSMLEGLTTKFENICRETDCSEEIDTIQRYMNRLKNIK